MKWRKIIAVLLVLAMMSSMLLMTGCERKKTVESENQGKEKVEATKYYTADDYLENPELFVPVWADEWQPSAELLDFEEKWESFFKPDGRLMSMIHRGDNNVYYPENSIEGILSCIMAGADMLELDVVMTKDGVPMMMHDDTVTRTTNVEWLRKEGAAGLPESDNISEWTFEQVRRLRLLMNGEVTNYVVPTLEDVIKVCNNRCMVFLDTAGEYEFDWELDIYPLIQKYDAYRTVILPNGYSASLSTRRLIELLDMYEKDSGYKAAFRCGVSDSNVEAMVSMIEKYDLPKILRYGDYTDEAAELFEPYFGKYRIHANFIWEPYNDSVIWKKAHEKGFNFIAVDDCLEIQQYIDELYFQNK